MYVGDITVFNMSVLVIGHSFVRRMHQHLITQNDVILGLSQLSVHYHGVGGWMLRDLWNPAAMAVVINLSPSILMVEIGCNELSYRGVDPDQFAQSLDMYIQMIRVNTSVRRVVVIPIFDKWHPVKLSLPGFNHNVYLANLYMYELFAREPDVDFARCRGFYKEFAHRYLATDGVHLNEKGLKKHRFHYHRALIHASDKLGIPH